MRVFVPLLIVTVAGGLYGMCFPPMRIQPLAWVVLVPALVVIRRASWPRATLLAAVLAAAGAAATVDWLPRTMTTYFHQPIAVGVALFLCVTLLMVVPPYAAFAVCYKIFAARPSPALPLLAGAAWVAGEFFRAHFLTGNPWVLFGYSQAGDGRVVQIADLTGVYGVTFVLIVVNVALAELWLAWRVDARLRRAAVGGGVVAAVTLALAVAYGSVRLAGATPAPHQSPLVKVAIVQGNLDLGSQWRQDFYGKNLDVYLRLTHAALQEPGVQLVVWPESAMTFFLEDEPLYQSAIGRVLEPAGVQLLAGGPHTFDAAHPKYYNSVFAIAPQGRVIARYDKQHLLPFSEYFPLPQLDFLRRDFGRVREFTAADVTSPLPTAAGPAGVLICNEAMFPEIARARTRAGAAYLMNLTNDSWVNDRKFALIAFDMSTLRAIEQRRYVVRASTSGPSGIVDPLGRVVVETAVSTRETVSGSIAPGTMLSVYGQLGDAFALGCIVVTLGALVVRALLRSPTT